MQEPTIPRSHAQGLSTGAGQKEASTTAQMKTKKRKQKILGLEGTLEKNSGRWTLLSSNSPHGEGTHGGEHQCPHANFPPACWIKNKYFFAKNGQKALKR